MVISSRLPNRPVWKSHAGRASRTLNQVLADTMTLRDLYKKHHWQVAAQRFTSYTCCSMPTTNSRSASWTPLQNGFNCSAG